MALKKYFWSAAFFLFLVELYSILPPRVAAPAASPPPSAPYRRGIVHVHSVYSDGGGTVANIAEAAGLAGMDFVVLTDHQDSRARKEGFEKRYDGVDFFVEMEANTPAGHCLVFYSHTEASKLSDDAVNALAWQHFLSQDTRPGLFIAVAHPSNVKNPWSHLDRYPDGIEVVNFDSSWQRQLSESILDFSATVLISPFNSFLAAMKFFQVYPKDFTSWDGMNDVSQGHFGLLAHDTHSRLKLNHKQSLRWPDYLETFKLASNVIYYDEPLASDFAERKKQLYTSIRKGRIALSFHALYPFDGNDWILQCGDKSHRVGDTVSLETGKCRFLARTPASLPYGTLLKLIRNGEVHKEIHDGGAEVEIPVTADGVYRLEVWAKPHTAMRLLLNNPVPYVFYNPIYVR